MSAGASLTALAAKKNEEQALNERSRNKPMHVANKNSMSISVQMQSD